MPQQLYAASHQASQELEAPPANLQVVNPMDNLWTSPFVEWCGISWNIWDLCFGDHNSIDVWERMSFLLVVFPSWACCPFYPSFSHVFQLVSFKKPSWCSKIILAHFTFWMFAPEIIFKPSARKKHRQNLDFSIEWTWIGRLISWKKCIQPWLWFPQTSRRS